MNRHIFRSFLLIIGILSAHCGNLFAAVRLPLAKSDKMAQEYTKFKQVIEKKLVKNNPALEKKPELLQHLVGCIHKSQMAAAAALPEKDNFDDFCDTLEVSDSESSEETISHPATTPPASPRSQSPTLNYDSDSEANNSEESSEADDTGEVFHDAQEEQDSDFHDAQEYEDEIILSNDPYFSKEGRAYYLHYIEQIASSFNKKEAQEIELIVATLFDENIDLTLEDIENMMDTALQNATHAGSIMRVLLQKKFLDKLRFMKLDNKTYNQWQQMLERAEQRFHWYPTENNAYIVEKIKGKILLLPKPLEMQAEPAQQSRYDAIRKQATQSQAAPAEQSVYNPIRYVVAAKEITFLVAIGAEYWLINRGNTWMAKPWRLLARVTQ